MRGHSPAMNKRIPLVAFGLLGAAVCACGSKAPGREAWAVGTYIGGGSFLTGPSSCTYDAPPAVAELSRNEKGNAFMAKLVGPGAITETCGSNKTVHDVLVATALRIDGPATVKVGASGTTDFFSVKPLAGTRELMGVHQGGEQPQWSLGADCDGVAAFGPVLGSQDTGGPDITRTLVPTKPGTCTISAGILGVTATKTVTIK